MRSCQEPKPRRRGARKERTVTHTLEALDLIGPTDLLDLTSVARALGYPASTDGLETNVSPRGHRVLSRVPRVPEAVRDRLVSHFGSLQALLGATVEDLQHVEGRRCGGRGSRGGSGSIRQGLVICCGGCCGGLATSAWEWEWREGFFIFLLLACILLLTLPPWC